MKTMVQCLEDVQNNLAGHDLYDVNQGIESLQTFMQSLAERHLPVKLSLLDGKKNVVCLECTDNDHGWPCHTIELVRQYLDEDFMKGVKP